MILDKLLQLSNAQAVTDADAYSTNTFDCGDVTPKRQIGDGEPLAICIVVTTAAGNSGGSFTNTFDFIAVQSVNANLSSHDEMVKRRIPAAELVVGAVVVLDIPIGRPTKRYIGARYELGTGDTITVSAYIIPRSFVPAFIAYANGYAV